MSIETTNNPILQSNLNAKKPSILNSKTEDSQANTSTKSKEEERKSPLLDEVSLSAAAEQIASSQPATQSRPDDAKLTSAVEEIVDSGSKKIQQTNSDNVSAIKLQENKNKPAPYEILASLRQQRDEGEQIRKVAEKAYETPKINKSDIESIIV